MSVTCDCGADVSERYVRVMTRRDEDGVECCPRCEDKIRRNGKILDARTVAGVDTDAATDGGDA